MEEWLKKWQEGMDSIEEAQVALERMKHRNAVMHETLDRIDALLG